MFTSETVIAIFFWSQRICLFLPFESSPQDSGLCRRASPEHVLCRSSDTPTVERTGQFARKLSLAIEGMLGSGPLISQQMLLFPPKTLKT
jgi:hypothetical protein